MHANALATFVRVESSTKPTLRMRAEKAVRPLKWSKVSHSSVQMPNFEIHLLPNRDCFLLQAFHNCNIPWILQLLCSFIWIFPTCF
jgi:hypothetical protein